VHSEWFGELMDRKYIDDRHIAARYLADQLSDSEREAFESYYVEHPEMMQELEVAARFKVGLMKMHEAGELGQLLKRPARFPRTLQFAAAAAVIVAAVGISIFYMRGPSTPTLLAALPAAFVDGRGVPLPVTSTHTLLRARGNGYDAEISSAASPATTELRIRAEFEAEPPGYRVALSSIGDDGESTLLAEIGHLAATEDGFVHVYLNGPRSTGTYTLVLSGDEGTSAAGKASTFVIRVR
jgi:hypothetical protein